MEGIPETVEKKRKGMTFQESSNFARLAFVIAIIIFFLTGILIGALGPC